MNGRFADHRHARGALRFMAAAVFTLPVSAIGACDRTSNNRHRDFEPVRILVIGEGKDESSWPVIEATGRAFESAHPRVTVITESPAVASPKEQKALLKGALTRGFDAVCVLPVPSDALRGSVSEIANAGVPIILIGRDIKDSQRSAYSGPSQSELGRATATACGKVLENRSRTIMLLHANESNHHNSDRFRGFMQELPVVGGVHIVREMNCDGESSRALQLCKSESRKYPRVGCWVLLDDWPLRVLRPEDRLFGLGITIVLCNADPAHWPRMEDGQIQAMVAYDLQAALQEGLSTAFRMTRPDDKRFVTEVHIESEVITEDNFAEFRTRWALWRQGRPSPRDP